jgi:hypothetical protein
MRLNLLNNTIRDFNSNHFSEIKNQIINNSKKYIPVLYGKADKSLLIIKNKEKNSSEYENSYMKNSISNVVDSLRQLYPEKDGIYTNITSRFLAKPEFLKLAYSQLKNKESNLISIKNNHRITIDGISQN